jgi:vancomycin permeability regulator SanA
VAALALAATLFVSLSFVLVAARAADLQYHDVQTVPVRPVAIIFGAKVYESGVLSPVLDARVRAGVELYQASKVRKLLMTGDNGRASYDEVTAMKRRAVALGVPAVDVVRDFAGFRTYDSCYRARDVFGIDRAVLVTQAFHLNRALYLARQLGIDAVGYVAEPGMPDGMIQASERRELLARPAAVLDTLLHRRPKYLGRREPLFEDERPDR